MTVPLVVLAGLLAVGGGLINLPFTDDLKFLEHWLEPVVHGAEAHLSLSGTEQVLLAVVAIVGRPGRHRPGRAGLPAQARCPAVEPEILAHAWYFDETIATFVGGPARPPSRAPPPSTGSSSTARSTAPARWCGASAARLRTVQTGYVRNYALAIAIGVVALLVYFVTQAGAVTRRPRLQRIRRARLPDPHRPGRRCPRPARSWWRLLPAVPARAASRPRRSWSSIAAAALGGWMLVAFRPATPASSSSASTPGSPTSASPGTSGVDGISLFLVVLTAVPVPDRPAGHRPRPRRQAVLRLAPGARGRLPRRVPGPRPLPVLRDVRDRARADVLPHRRLGPRPAGLRRAEVLPLHDVRLGADAGRHPDPRLPDRQRHRRTRSPSTWSSWPTPRRSR